jgi:para-nitrobenzyl esterase
VWTAFARSGNPNTAAMPDCAPYDTERRATMLFDTESQVVDDRRAQVRKIMLS